jgi:hypothetical protein
MTTLASTSPTREWVPRPLATGSCHAATSERASLSARTTTHGSSSARVRRRWKSSARLVRDCARTDLSACRPGRAMDTRSAAVYSPIKSAGRGTSAEISSPRFFVFKAFARACLALSLSSRLPTSGPPLQTTWADDEGTVATIKSRLSLPAGARSSRFVLGKSVQIRDMVRRERTRDRPARNCSTRQGVRHVWQERGRDRGEPSSMLTGLVTVCPSPFA